MVARHIRPTCLIGRKILATVIPFRCFSQQVLQNSTEEQSRNLYCTKGKWCESQAGQNSGSQTHRWFLGGAGNSNTVQYLL